MKRVCLQPRCANPVTAKGRCDQHRRELERERSRARRGGLKRGPLTDVIEARDADRNYRYPKRGGGDE
jgi:hypothetical protein